jgi:hypothetical protein
LFLVSSVIYDGNRIQYSDSICSFVGPTIVFFEITIDTILDVGYVYFPPLTISPTTRMSTSIIVLRFVVVVVVNIIIAVAADHYRESMLKHDNTREERLPTIFLDGL